MDSYEVLENVVENEIVGGLVGGQVVRRCPWS